MWHHGIFAALDSFVSWQLFIETRSFFHRFEVEELGKYFADLQQRTPSRTPDPEELGFEADISDQSFNDELDAVRTELVVHLLQLVNEILIESRGRFSLLV